MRNILFIPFDIEKQRIQQSYIHAFNYLKFNTLVFQPKFKIDNENKRELKDIDIA